MQTVCTYTYDAPILAAPDAPAAARRARVGQFGDNRQKLITLVARGPLRIMARSKMTAGVAHSSSALDSPSRRRLPPLLRAAWFGLNQAFRRRLAHLAITPDQFTVLRTLTEHEGITQRQLSALMSSDPNTVASLLERMAKAALIERRAHARDRRAHSLRLTPVGKRKFTAARNIALELQAEVLGTLPEAEREHFLDALERVAGVCQQLTGRKKPAILRRAQSGTSRTR